MISQKLQSGDFIGVSENNTNKKILLQLTDKDSQTRVALNLKETHQLISKLKKIKDKMSWNSVDDAMNKPDPYESKELKNNELDIISQSLSMLLFVIIFYGALALVALWRILYELQRG